MNKMIDKVMNEIENALGFNNASDFADVALLDYDLYVVHIKDENTALSISDPHICIGWSFLGDLENVQTREELTELYSGSNPEEEDFISKKNINQIWEFIHELKINDYVIFAEETEINIGKITSNYIYNEKPENEHQDYKYRRNVKWLKNNISINSLSSRLQQLVKYPLSFYKCNDYKGVVSDLINDTYVKDINLEEYCSYNFDDSPEVGGENRIVYGIPGCGKSYYVENVITKDYTRKYRTTFYQDYTATDFVGQLLPKSDGKEITYEFVPGPFTHALEDAILHPKEKVALIIEEINRGNAASIFGEIFQLLDRDEKGNSRYPISNFNIINYFNQKYKEYKIFKNIIIPSNLDIFATMNTSDQNVYTLDTAFKRRWDFEKISNKFDKEDNRYIPSGEITWKEFVNKINEYITKNQDVLNAEDKQIGAYFVDDKLLIQTKDPKPEEEKELVNKKEKFAHKVLEYIWNDVAKFHKDKWFIPEIKTIDQLVEKYKKDGIGVFKSDVFEQE